MQLLWGHVLWCPLEVITPGVSGVLVISRERVGPRHVIIESKNVRLEIKQMGARRGIQRAWRQCFERLLLVIHFLEYGKDFPPRSHGYIIDFDP
jgi:hypothetical protein